uniref:Uncharacterized protein n=1 Tax=Euplotes harpa TaxID=151035 RepID=A0A7S3JC47_9SPIT|mmetsp:Transcript_28557/g.32639  ORF Transcript_28557/g.32639 Transcript_28557/m.32639 type:complete len:108 (+) Transcript_28557:298-621(+)
MDLIAVIQLASSSKLDATIASMMRIYGFVAKIFTRDEFHFYLDSLFSGIINTALVTGKRVPLKELRGKRVKEEDIEKLVSDIFEAEEVLERNLFTDRLIAHDELGPL